MGAFCQVLQLDFRGKVKGGWKDRAKDGYSGG